MEHALNGMQVEQEEEFLTNTLQKRLEKVRGSRNDQPPPRGAGSALVVALARSSLQTQLPVGAHTQKGVTACGQSLHPAAICNGVHRMRDAVRPVSCQLQLTKEKVDLENRLTAEQEYIMNKLQAQLEMLAREKGNLQKVPAYVYTSAS